MAKKRKYQLAEFRKLTTGNLGLAINLNEVDKELKLVQLQEAQRSFEKKVFAKDEFKVEIINEDGESYGVDTGLVASEKGKFDRIVEIGFGGSLANIPEGFYTSKISLRRGEIPPVPLPSARIFIQDPTSVPQGVALKPTPFEVTEDESLWEEINGTELNFNEFQRFIEIILCAQNNTTVDGIVVEKDDRLRFKNRLPFVNVDEYALIKFATDVFMRNRLKINGARGYFGTQLNLPYYEHLSESIEEILDDYDSGKQGNDEDCVIRQNERLHQIPAIELIWSYWMEQAMLIQTMNVISLRFQNIKGLQEIEPLVRFDTSPLRTLSNILWGFIQDEQHLTSLHRRVFEYQHAYNLTLEGRAVPKMRGIDNRSNFLEAFHNLLHYASVFFKDYDDMTRRADGFPLLTALREVHLLLAEGNHNSYFNMTWTTRAEMLSMQYILSRQEMRLFLGGRPMVPYPEIWMDRVDTMKLLQNWDSTSVLHYYDLATSGEKLLLGIRYGDWTKTSFNADDAGNWAIAFRDHAMKYINAYRIVTGVDLSVDAARIMPEERALQPSSLIQRRLHAGQKEPQVIELSPQRRSLARRY